LFIKKELMKRYIFLALFFGTIFNLQAQIGVYTSTPHSSSISDVGSTNKGLLIPRLNITSLTSKSPVTASIKDGLLAYNVSTGGLSKTIVFWDADANLGLGAWSPQLYFGETPKIATIGLTANRTGILDNSPAGAYEYIVNQPTNNYKILNSGYMPSLGFRYRTNHWDIELGSGTYIIEISYLLNAPPANPASNAVALQGSYYNMGYFSQLGATQYNPVNSTYGATVFGRVEGSSVSTVLVDHRVRFLHTFSTSATGLTEITLYLGRRSASNFNDLVDIIANSTIIKITKLL
jgi:hypothetical protein